MKESCGFCFYYYYNYYLPSFAPLQSHSLTVESDAAEDTKMLDSSK